LAAAGLALLTPIAITVVRQRAEERESRRQTALALRSFGSFLHDVAATGSRMPPGLAFSQDPSGQIALFDDLLRRPRLPATANRTITAALELDQVVLDGWGRGLVYRCPGRVHPEGWDLYSVGASSGGQDEPGNELLVGEDLAAPSSAPAAR
jgi:hypothetical protein